MKKKTHLKPGTHRDVRAYVMSVLQLSKFIDIGKYWSVPSLIGKKKRKIFVYLSEKV